MQKVKLNSIIFLLAGLVIILGGNSDVYGRACSLQPSGNTLGLASPGARGDDYGCFLVIEMQVVDISRIPEAHVDISYTPLGGPTYQSGTPNRDSNFLADYRVKFSYTVTCQDRKGTERITLNGPVQDSSDGFIWWALGDTCGPFAGWFQGLLTDVAAKLGGGTVVLKEQGLDNEEDLSGHFNFEDPGEGLLWNEPLQYIVEFTITKLR